MPALFITGTGTEMGKTFLAAQLVRHLRGKGHAVCALKPVVTGFSAESAHLSDTALLSEAMGIEPSQDVFAAISPWRYRAALAPNIAAELEGRHVSLHDVLAFTQATLRNQSEAWTVVEGIGGVMVPLDADCTVLDLIANVRIPAILVAGSYLGSLSHTLTALAALSERRVSTPSIVVNESPASTVTVQQTLQGLRPFVLGTDTALLGMSRNPGCDELAAICQRILLPFGIE